MPIGLICLLAEFLRTTVKHGHKISMFVFIETHTALYNAKAKLKRLALIVNAIRTYTEHLRYSVIGYLSRLHTSWVTAEVMHTIRQVFHLIILLAILGLTLYLLPAEA